MAKMTPDEFEAKMKEIAEGWDDEANHARADELMEDLLVQLGYDKGIEVFRKMEKYYA